MPRDNDVYKFDDLCACTCRLDRLWLIARTYKHSYVRTDDVQLYLRSSSWVDNLAYSHSCSGWRFQDLLTEEPWIGHFKVLGALGPMAFIIPYYNWLALVCFTGWGGGEEERGTVFEHEGHRPLWPPCAAPSVLSLTWTYLSKQSESREIIAADA